MSKNKNIVINAHEKFKNWTYVLYHLQSFGLLFLTRDDILYIIVLPPVTNISHFELMYTN